MSENIEIKMNQFSAWIGRNRVLSSVSESFMMILPIIILGSIFTLLVGLNFTPYQSIIGSLGIKPLLNLVPSFTTEWISIYLASAMAYIYAKKIEVDEGRFVIVLLSLLSFLLVTPFTSVIQADASVVKSLSFEWLGSQGMFSALVIPIIVAQITKLFLKNKWTIKLPDSVPPAIQASFSALVPSFVIAILFIVLNALFSYTPFEHFHALIYGLLLLPLQNLSNNIWTMLFIIVMMHVIWFFGMHGTMILGPVILILLTNATLANTQAYAMGDPLPNILTLGFLTTTMLGGIGSTLSLSVMMLFAKSKRYSTLSKVCITPSIFGINEPIVFGLPIVLNGTMMIPFVLVPLLNAIILYALMKMTFLPYPALMNLPTGTPVFFDGFLQMGTMGIVVQILIFMVDYMVYYPFFKKLDQIALISEEQENV